MSYSLVHSSGLQTWVDQVHTYTNSVRVANPGEVDPELVPTLEKKKLDPDQAGSGYDPREKTLQKKFGSEFDFLKFIFPQYEI